MQTGANILALPRNSADENRTNGAMGSPMSPLTVALSSRVSTEIFFAIIDHMDSEKDVQVCSLVCKAWLSRTRARVFSNIILPARRALFFLNLVDSPHATIPPFIRNLSIGGGWIAEEGRALTVALTYLSNLKQMEFLSLEAWCPDPSFEKATMGCLYKFPGVGILHMKYVRFSRFEVLAKFISSFPLLEEIILDNVTWSHPYPFSSLGWYDAGVAVVPPRLRALCIHACDCRHISLWLLLSKEIPAIESVRFPDLSLADLDAVGGFLMRVAESVERLEIGFSYPNNEVQSDTFNHIVAACPTTLRCLWIFRIYLAAPCSRENGGLYTYKWVSSLIFQVASERMEEIGLHITLASKEQLDEFDWGTLSEALGNKKFIRMKRFCVTVAWASKWGCNERDEIRDSIGRRLIRYQKSGILDICFE